MEIVYRKVYDVSVHNGLIDWDQIRADGVDFVMIRAGYGRNNIDERFVDNASACVRLGIPFGVYWFSYGYTAAMAEQEAACVLEAVQKYRLKCPVAFDLEYDTVRYAATKGVTIDRALASSMADAFCSRVTRAGFEAWNYANLDYVNRMFDGSLLDKYPLWFARYNSEPGRTGMVLWQHSSSGRVNGISGKVDLNYGYRTIESIPLPAAEDTIEAAAGVGNYSVAKDGNKYFTLNGKQTNFKVKEFASPDGTDEVLVAQELIRFLQRIRDHFRKPLIIDSGYHTGTEKMEEGTVPGSYHDMGYAADIRITGVSTIKLAAYAESLGITGIGLYMDYVHVDMRALEAFWVDISGDVDTFGYSNPWQKPEAGTVLKIGSRGEGVKWLQTELVQEGYKIAVDGIYGSDTEEAVWDYQKRKGLAVDGKAGDVTMGRLDG